MTATAADIEKALADNAAADLALREEQRRLGRPPEILAMIEERRELAKKVPRDQAAIEALGRKIDAAEASATAEVRKRRAALGKARTELRAKLAVKLAETDRSKEEIEADLAAANEALAAAQEKTRRLSAELTVRRVKDKVEDMSPIERAVLQSIEIGPEGIPSEERVGSPGVKSKKK